MNTIQRTMPVAVARQLSLNELLPETLGTGQLLVTVIIQELPNMDIQNEIDSGQMQEKPYSKRRIGFLKGQISCPDDFDTMGQDEIIALFEGDP